MTAGFKLLWLVADKTQAGLWADLNAYYGSGCQSSGLTICSKQLMLIRNELWLVAFLVFCRSWNTGSITLCDTADATDSSSSSGKPSVQWLLLDEAVKYARLLQAGEHILMYCPTVRRHQQHRQQDPDLVLESSSGLWLLVNEDSGSHCSSSSHIDKDACYTTDAQESGQAGIQAEPSSASKVAAFASSPHRVPEASCGQYMVLRGIVSNLLVPKNTSSSSNNLHMRDSSTRMTCCISDTAADMLASRNRLLELQFEPDSRKKQQVQEQMHLVQVDELHWGAMYTLGR